MRVGSPAIPSRLRAIAPMSNSTALVENATGGWSFQLPRWSSRWDRGLVGSLFGTSIAGGTAGIPFSGPASRRHPVFRAGEPPASRFQGRRAAGIPFSGPASRRHPVFRAGEPPASRFQGRRAAGIPFSGPASRRHPVFRAGEPPASRFQGRRAAGIPFSGPASRRHPVCFYSPQLGVAWATYGCLPGSVTPDLKAS